MFELYCSTTGVMFSHVLAFDHFSRIKLAIAFAKLPYLCIIAFSLAYAWSQDMRGGETVTLGSLSEVSG